MQSRKSLVREIDEAPSAGHSRSLSRSSDFYGESELSPRSQAPTDDFLPFSPPSSTSPSFAFGQGNTFQPEVQSAAVGREHSRRHSRIHSRNLSVFFPRPGESQNGFASIPEDGVSAEEDDREDLHVDIPSAGLKGWSGANGQGFTRKSSQTSLSDMQGVSPSKANSRRGHHHRHSLSHNFSLTPSDTTSGGTTPISPDAPKSVPSSLNLASSVTPSSLPLSSTAMSLRARYSHLPTLVRFCLAVGFHLPFSTQLALLLATLELALGAMLWVYGQSGESLAVTGLGYLVVFDGLGALSSIVVEGNARDVDLLWELIGPSLQRAGSRQLRYPFGTYRLTTISQFAQCIYLLFSAVYVCKESIEHVLLLHDPTDELTTAAGAASHGAAHGSMGHGEGRGSPVKEMVGTLAGDWVEIGVTMPTGLLLLSTLLCLMTAFFLRNHASLTEAVGPSTYALRPRPTISRSEQQTFMSAVLSLLSNPFSLLVLVFAFALSTASITIPAVQLAPLDKVLALLQSVAMFYVAYPAAEATGKVLLQTAPPSDARNMATFMRGLREVESHPLVIYIPQPHIWQLTPHPKASAPSKSGFWSSKAAHIPQGASILVVTLHVHIKPDALDRDVLEITQMARDKCALALKGGSDFPPGELTVVVKKGMPSESSAHKGCSHDHGHQGHSHAHSHAGTHDHSHDHLHSHAGHDHGAGVSHGSHAHSHGEGSHSHSEHGHSHSSHDHSAHSHSHGHHH